MKKYKIYDWACNLMSNIEFDSFEEANDFLPELILSVYGDLSDSEYEEQVGEYEVMEAGV